MWGPELVMVYNDAYAPLLGERHPEALGACVRRTSGATSGPTSAAWPRTCSRAEQPSPRPPAGDGPARVRGGDLLHLLLQPRLRAGRPGRRPARHGGRDDQARTRGTPDERAAAAGQPAAVGAPPGRDTQERCPPGLDVLAGARSDCPFALVYLAGLPTAASPRLVADQGTAAPGRVAGRHRHRRVRPAGDRHGRDRTP